MLINGSSMSHLSSDRRYGGPKRSNNFWPALSVTHKSNGRATAWKGEDTSLALSLSGLVRSCLVAIYQMTFYNMDTIIGPIYY